MKLKIINKTLFILFNIGFAVSVFFLFAWLDGIQKQADAQNKEYTVGESIPFGDIDIVVTKVEVIPDTTPPEVSDPYVEFGGYLATENCKVIIPFQEYTDCSLRNVGRRQIMNALYNYHRNRLTINYTVKSRTADIINLSETTLAIKTHTERNVKEPVAIIEGVSLTPYGESDPIIKDGGKETERQMWVDLHPSNEPTITAIFTYKDTIRKVPIEVFALVPKNS